MKSAEFHNTTCRYALKLLTILFVWECGCGPLRASDVRQHPSILLIVSDDQRPDTVHALGNPVIETPALDRLVRMGTVFDRATCANPICTPSRAEILTGCSGFRMQVRDFGGAISPDIPRMAAWFRDAGYRTWYVGKWHNNGRPQDHGYSSTRGLFTGGGGEFAQPQQDHAGRDVTGYKGWIFRDDEGNRQPEKGVGLTPDISRDFADAAIDVITQSHVPAARNADAAKNADAPGNADGDRTADAPFFLHVNFTAPHDPLMLPSGWEQRYAAADMPMPPNFLPQHPFDHGNFLGRDEQLFLWPRTTGEVQSELAAYYAVISSMDQQIGRILDCLEQRPRAQPVLVIFASDHGVAVGSHGLRGKQNMYEHTIGVPLIMAGPGIPQNRRVSAQCYLRDLFPTLCDLAGIPSPESRIDGISLKPILDGQQAAVHEFIVGYFRDSQRMIRTDEWKYIIYPEVDRQQLFHLTSDPSELHDLIGMPEHAARQQTLHAELVDWFRDAGDPVFSHPAR